MVKNNKTHERRKVVAVDFTECVVYREEFKLSAVCSLCRRVGAFVIIEPREDARVFGSDSLCRKCLGECFDVVMAV